MASVTVGIPLPIRTFQQEREVERSLPLAAISLLEV